MRFRSGTLQRSIKRWGPKFPKVQRVQHGWKYVTLENQSMDIDGTTPTDVIICDADDWALTGTGVGCKNMTVDLAVAVAWTPKTDAANVFHNASIRWGLFCLDEDDVGAGIDGRFTDTRALRWGMLGNNFQGIDLTAADGPFWQPMTATRWNFHVRAKQRYMKFGDELRFVICNSTDLLDVIGDQRLHIFGRVSWEIP